MVASQLGLFERSPWALAVYPAILSAKGVIHGLLSGRLGTALHLGTIYPRFSKNTKSFYTLISATVVMTLVISVVMSLVSLVFGSVFWGARSTDALDIVAVVVATMSLGLTLSVVTIKVAFVTFKRGLDPDIVVYPIMSTVADIFITVCFAIVLNAFLVFNFAGKSVIAVIILAHLLLVLYIISKNFREQDFRKNLRESLYTMLFVSVIVNVTGTVLKNISAVVENRGREIYTVYPALIDMVGDVGSVVGSTATTKLALGLLRPSLSSIRHHAKTILSAWAASIIMFFVLAVLALSLNGTLSLSTFSNLISILLIANVIAVSAIILLSYGISILTFQKGLDPDNFVIPIESSFADSLMSIALLAALVLVG
ncbi:MAG TPA: magnesium transporter [Candidatus Bathyarchaeia archaeon]|nr:magnesium transporter [Candidatus Bathyarchaeia archaeon]